MELSISVRLAASKMSASLINALPIKSVGLPVFPAVNGKNIAHNYVGSFSATCHYFSLGAGNLPPPTDLNSAAGVGVEINNPPRKAVKMGQLRVRLIIGELSHLPGRNRDISPGVTHCGPLLILACCLLPSSLPKNCITAGQHRGFISPCPR